MDKLIEKGVKVDAIITDPPYGTTACKWDSVIPFDEMWKRLKKLRKDKAAVVIFGSEPFSSALRMSNVREFKYDWVWEKPQGANFMLVKYQPYKVHELVSVFYRHYYYPIKTAGAPYVSGKGDSGEITGRVKKIQTVNDGTRYPRSIQFFSQNKQQSVHPTQKPVELMKYLVETYTTPKQTVLDFTMGAGSTGVACMEAGRHFIGIEIDAYYCEVAQKRIVDARTVQESLLRSDGQADSDRDKI